MLLHFKRSRFLQRELYVPSKGATVEITFGIWIVNVTTANVQYKAGFISHALGSGDTATHLIINNL